MNRIGQLSPRPARVCGRTLVLGALALLFIPSVALGQQCPGVWVQLSATGPAPRSDSAMAYDSQSDRIVLFGGGATTVFGDTWAWDGGRWKQISVTGPTARNAHAMAYDSARHIIVLFGGDAEGQSFLSDTWEWDGAQWNARSASGPIGRHGAAFGFDPLRSKSVLFGGSTTSGGGFVNDVWEWDGTTWSKVSPTSSLPDRRTYARMDFSGPDSQILLYGGYVDTGSSLADTWLWNGAAWTSTSSADVNKRYAHGMAYDAAGGRMVTFGGIDAPSTVLGDTWQRIASSWSQADSSGPTARSSMAMTYDARRCQVVLFGGATSTGIRLGDTWAWSERPIVTSEPVSGTACAERSFTFSLIAVGNGPFTYQWQRESAPSVFADLADGPTTNGSLILGASTATLKISALAPADAGNYQCIVSNLCGPVPSNAATLSISTLTGDLDCDCKVDLADLAILLGAYGSVCN